MDTEEPKRQSKNWRGRRHMACRAADILEEVVAELGSDDGSQLLPENGLPQIPDAVRREIQNQVSVLLRLILAANDGNVSKQTIRRY